MKIGIKQLRDGLSRYVGLAKQGEEILVTDRGRVVAKLSGVGEEANLARLEREGRLSLPKGPKRTFSRDSLIRPASGATVSDLVREQR